MTNAGEFGDGDIECSISLQYRPVETDRTAWRGRFLNRFNHAYLYITRTITGDGRVVSSSDLVEGLPERYHPEPSLRPYGNLIGHVFRDFPASGNDPRDDKNHPASDPCLGSVKGSLELWRIADEIAENALLLTRGGNAVAYDPTSNLYGANGNWLVGELLRKSRLHLPAPPSAPGYGRDWATLRTPATRTGRIPRT